MIRSSIKKGDLLEYDNTHGVVQKITLTEIVIKRNNEILYIPTSLLLKKGFIVKRQNKKIK